MIVGSFDDIGMEQLIRQELIGQERSEATTLIDTIGGLFGMERMAGEENLGTPLFHALLSYLVFYHLIIYYFLSSFPHRPMGFYS